MKGQQQLMTRSQGAGAATDAPPARLGLLLRLPPRWEAAWRAGSSTERTLLAADLAACAYGALVNGKLLFSLPILQASKCMLPHERAGTVVFLLLALGQLLAQAAWPQRLRAVRDELALANRLLRLLGLLVSAALATPTHLAAQMWSCQARPTHAPVQSGHAQLLRILLVPTFVYLSASNFCVAFRLHLPLQLVTMLAALAINLRRVCPSAQLHGDAMAACDALAQLAWAAGELMGWPLPSAPAALPAAARVCGDPLASMLLLTVLAHVSLLLLLPALVVYRVERAAKARFLHQLSLHHTQGQAQVQQPQLQEAQQEQGQGSGSSSAVAVHVTAGCTPSPLLVHAAWLCSGVVMCGWACFIGLGMLLQGRRLHCLADGSLAW